MDTLKVPIFFVTAQQSKQVNNSIESLYDIINIFIYYKMEVQLLNGLQQYAEVALDPLPERRIFSAYQGNRHNQPTNHILKNRHRAVQSANIFTNDKIMPSKSALGFVDKETKGRQIISLKNQNHLLKKQNHTMKFKIDNLEKKLKDKRELLGTLDSQTNLANIRLLNSKDEKIQKLIKQLEQVQSEFVRVKKSVRYTQKHQIQVQKQVFQEQTKRLRIKTERVLNELKEQKKYTEKIRKQLKEMKLQLKKGNRSDEREGTGQQDSPNRQIMIYSKEKEMEIQTLKTKVAQLEQKMNRRPEPQKPKFKVNKICSDCQKLKKQNQQLKQSIQRLQKEINSINNIRIHQPSQSEKQCVRKFLVLRLKAHGLSLDDVIEKYMFPKSPDKISDSIDMGQLKQMISLIPFRITNNRYIQIFIYMLCHQDETTQMIIQPGKIMKKQMVLQNFINFMGKYQLFTKDNELELFESISQYMLVHQQFIFKKLVGIEQSQKGLTLSKFSQFFTQIVEDTQLIQTIIEYMLIQIINASEDLEHLSIQRLFQVFCTGEEI